MNNFEIRDLYVLFKFLFIYFKKKYILKGIKTLLSLNSFERNIFMMMKLSI